MMGAKPRFKPQYRVVTVHWNDACAHFGWRDPKSIDPVARCQTRGFLVRSDKNTVSVALSVGEAGDVSEVMTIPRGCIDRID